MGHAGVAPVHDKVPTLSYEHLPVVEVVVLHGLPDAVRREVDGEGADQRARLSEARFSVDLIYERVVLRRQRLKAQVRNAEGEGASTSSSSASWMRAVPSSTSNHL